MRNLSCGGKMFCPLSNFLVIGSDNSAAPSRYYLISIKAESRYQSKVAGMPTFVKRAQRFGSILYYGDIVQITDCNNFIYSSRQSKTVHGHTGSYSFAR